MKTLTTPRRNCPHADCPSHAPRARSRVVKHSRLRTRLGIRRRFLCKVCGRTFVRTLGTVYYRMRKPRRSFDAALEMQTEGCTQASISRLQRVSPGTVSRWFEKAAEHVRRFEAEHLSIDDPVEIQIDELKAYGAGKYDRTWLYSGIEVSTRLWVAAEVGSRTLRATFRFVRAIREVCQSGVVPPLVTSDEFKYYGEVVRRTFGPAAVHVQVDNRYRRGRIVRSNFKLVLGSQAKLEIVLDRLEDSKRPNTAFVERLNLFLRFACCYLRRRTPAPMRKPERLRDAIDVLRCYYNFIRPHSAHTMVRGPCTPAMMADIFSRPLSFRDIFNWVPPPKPGFVKLEPRRCA
jgi:transposase-like protein